METQYYQRSLNEGCSSNSNSNLGGIEESEVVDELLQILVECMKKADIRGQEILLRKFFFEIEKEMSLERFLVERLQHSKISRLFDQRLFRSEAEVEAEAEISTRELNVAEEGETTSEKEKLERFKIKTVQVGVVVKEEKAT